MRLFVLLTALILAGQVEAFVPQKHVKIVTAGSLAASLSSTAVDLTEYNSSSITAVWSGGGSPTGDLKLQISDDLLTSTQTCADVTTWTDYTGSTISIVTDGDAAWNLGDPGFRCVRFRWVRTSGTGTINVYFHGKGT
jgi:hypothetical protein